MRLILVITTLFLIYSCKQEKKIEKPVAQVFENVLYHNEIADFVPKGTSVEDSILMSQSYIRNWITQKLLLQKAIKNLSNEESNIQKQVEDYRTSLLIHQYKQKLITQRLKEDISNSDIEKYYYENENNFVLSTSIVKAIFFILPKTAPHLKEMRKWFISNEASAQESLEDYCLTNARKYDTFQNKWVAAKSLLNLLPGDFASLNQDILNKRHIEKEDETNYYFLKIKDLKEEQTVAPLEYVHDEITLILKNKKKLQFENELEKQINQEGIEKNYVKIY